MNPSMDRFQPPTAAEQNQREQCSVCGCEPDFLTTIGNELVCDDCSEKIEDMKKETENE